MFEGRLRRLLLLFYVLLGVIAARAFALQVLDAQDEEGHPWASLAGRSREFVVHPRRGEIFWADGTKMAWNVPSYGLEILWGEVDHRVVPTIDELRAAFPPDLSEEWRKRLEHDLTRLGPKLLFPKGEQQPPLRRWVCGICSSQRASRGVPTRSCHDCGATEYEEVQPFTAEDLAIVLGMDIHRVHVALIASMRRWDLNRNWRSHALLVRIPETAVESITVYPELFGGFLPLARNGRDVDPLGRLVAGSARLPDADDLLELASELREAQGLHKFTAAEVYPSLVGASLLEGAQDELLRGVPGRSEHVRLRENEFESTVNVLRPVLDGADLHTTLRRDLQELAFEIVAAAPEGGHGAAVVIDVRTGAVVALASTENDALDHSRSHVTPGSVYKLVTSVALLAEGHSPDELVTCEGTGRIPGGGRYKCMHTDGPLALHDAFVRSCNGYFSQQADAVGAAALVRAAERLGMSKRPLLSSLGHGRSSYAGLELSRPGGRGDPDLWKRWNLVHIGIGQGAASASPLQVAVAYARIASGGKLIEPFVLERDRREPSAIPVDPVLSRWAAILQEAARGVVADQEHGTASDEPGLAAIRAAGKTGTADVVIGGQKLNNSSFVGYAPFDDPRYCAIVSFEGVAQKVYGAAVAGEPVARLLARALDE